MLYEIINMSDPYTIECPDLEIATIACVLLGNGQYAFRALDGPTSEDVPIMLFGPPNEWFIEKFSVGLQDLYRRVMDTRAEELAKAFDSVLVGSASDRKAFEAITASLQSDRERETAWIAWHNEKRSSMNDIGGRARERARRIRAGRPGGPAAPAQVFTS